MAVIAVTVILIISSIGLIATVLLQSGRSAGLSGSISGAGEAFFGKKKGLDELLAKITAVIAVIFMLSSLGLGLLLR